MKKNYQFSSLLCLVALILIITSCKKKGSDSSIYVKSLADIAMQYNKSCPREEPNGTRLESVIFADNTMTFRMSLTDQAIVTINLDDTRDSIISHMTPKLKKFLTKGNCNLEYKYISPNDSSSITIIPKELEYSEDK